MKAAFNATCSRCKLFMPRCAEVFFRAPGKATVYLSEPQTLCRDCRKVFRGHYRLGGQHK